MYPATITSQGQISIPAPVRKMLGLSLNSTVLVSVEGKKAIIEPVPDFLSLAGSLKTNKKPLTNKQLEDVVAKAMAKQAVK